MTRASDAARAFLKLRGCPDQVVEGGLEGLIRRWREIVSQLEGYPLGLDDFLNDMDVRHLIFEVGPGNHRGLQKLDRQARRLLKPAGRCLWGEENVNRLGYREDLHWWYYSVPHNPGSELQEELAQS